MRRLDDQEDEQHVKALVYGHPGTGKTSFGVSAPEPLIALTERQGMVHVKQAARRLGKPVPRVILVEHARDLRALLRALHTGDRTAPTFKVYMKDSEGKEFLAYEGPWPQTLVLDSATDAGRLLGDEVREQSPPTRGKDGLPVDSNRFWNVLIQRSQALLYSIRDLPMHVVLLALANDKEKGDDDTKKVRSLTPSMPTRDLSTIIAATVNVVGYSYRRDVPGQGGVRKLEYGIQTTGPEYMTTKPFRPLRDQEVPDFTYWVQVVRGATELRPEPPPSEEMGGGPAQAPQEPVPQPEKRPEAPEAPEERKPEEVADPELADKLAKQRGKRKAVA